MNYRNFIWCFFVVFAGIISCGKEQQNTREERKNEVAALYGFFQRTFQEDLKDSPMLQTRLGIKEDYGKLDDFSHLRYAEDLKKAKARLAFLEDSIDPELLAEQAHLDYILYKRKLQNEIEDYDFRFYDYPINQMFGVHATLPAFLINMHAIDSVGDAQDYISRLSQFPRVFREVVEGLKLREMNGVLPPQFVFERTLDASENLLKGKPFEKSQQASTLLQDFDQKLGELEVSQATKDSLLIRAQRVLVDSVKPAYELLIETLKDQQQRATPDAGVWKFPKGAAYYKNRLKRMTTTDMTAEEIHQLGLREVKRIHGEMQHILDSIDYKGSLKDFFKFIKESPRFYYDNTPQGREAYLEEVRQVIDQMRSKLDSLFLEVPEAELVVKPVEAFREKTAGKAFYQPPALDGSRPGTYYANLYDMKAMPKYQMQALAYHEAIPGHHMQIALAQELDSVPMFRRLSHFPAYVEGWGLYAELIPKEMGLYTDAYADFGRLAMELWRAVRLVVDTGIHSQKWTREEAIDYYTTNTPNAESDAIKMVERHIVMPGQATAYKVEMNTFLELREESKKALGEAFDIREFHQVILGDGALPLDILKEKVEQYWQRAEKAVAADG